MDGCGCCTPRCMGTKLLVVGLLFVLNEYYFNWNVWVLIGSLLMIKGLVKMIMPQCACQRAEAPVVVKKGRK